MKGQIKGVRISGIACTVPSSFRTIEDEGDLFGGDLARINRLKRDIGVHKRHISLKGECASDLCEHAAKFLISKMNYDPLSIDGLITVTQTPDYFQPATSLVLHGRLGLAKDCATFDINLGCSGYIYGLWIASMMVSSGMGKRVLLLVGDTISRCVSPYDRAIAPLFGDAGSATLIEKDEPERIISFVLHSDGKGYNHLIIPAGAFRKKSSDETSKILHQDDGGLRSEEHLYMNGAEIFNFSIREVPPLIEEVLTLSGWIKEEIDYFIFHQANKFIIQNIARRLKISIEKAPYDVFEKYGNQSSASIPVTISEKLSSVRNTDGLKIIMAGFGAGLSWAACALTLNSIKCFPIMVLD